VTTQTSPQLRAREERTALIVWGSLVAVTVAGWRLVEAENSGTAVVALVAIFGLAKCWLIVRHFMDVRHAPRWLQIVTTAWMGILWLTLLVLFVRS
jgi:hypothetical protein